MTPAERLRDAATQLRDGGRTLMEEDVALALANWLDETARWVPVMEEPLAVADAVLGGGER